MPLQPNALISEVDFTMNKVAFVAVNKDGRFNQCPRCGNTVFSPAANFL
jgi:hypothetical protein